MRWPSLWSTSTSQDDEAARSKRSTRPTQTPGEFLDKLLSTPTSTTLSKPSPAPSTSQRSTEWSSILTTSPSQILVSPETIIPTVLLTSTCLAFYAFYRSYLRRIPAAGNISPDFFRNRSLVGRVTSVGDGDNFRVFHTPGGRLAGWGWLPWRRIPTEKKELKNKTVSNMVSRWLEQTWCSQNG